MTGGSPTKTTKFSWYPVPTQLILMAPRGKRGAWPSDLQATLGFVPGELWCTKCGETLPAGGDRCVRCGKSARTAIDPRSVLREGEWRIAT
jgi:hypothetical protein